MCEGGELERLIQRSNDVMKKCRTKKEKVSIRSSFSCMFVADTKKKKSNDLIGLNTNLALHME